ncbi:hypothetical protein E1264_01880 [Actinomadura sp. KC216]|uniref:hypothetical protein n=1 Tax=Actinomadura sp. KC216 TaxID=2530370 RepID=UPI001042EC3F|nr:hypothetical protein [Actinomadura sp. KC216]TDB91403.1 hypothetical protein E1264_01880 [Actinomadura sp. KC216]
MAAGAPARRSLDELASSLELEVCVERLLAHVFPGPDPDPETAEEDGTTRAGRHQVLETLIGNDAQLRAALLANDQARISERWRAVLRDRPGDLALHHELAVLYRERALRRIARGGSASELLVIATTLWALLLATGDFWRRAGIARDAEDAARDKIVGGLLDLHVAHGARALAEGRVAAARRHLRCLDACRSGDPEPVRELLFEHAIPFAHRVSARRLAGPARLAAEALERWCDDLVQDAESRVNDRAAISALDGIDKAYGAGIDRLAPFIRLGVPMRRVLVTGLEWHNELSMCHYNNGKDFDSIRDVLKSGREFADRLAPLCTAGEAHRPENQALSRYLLFRAVAAGTDDQIVADLTEALRWNPANDNAARVLVETYLDRGVRTANDQHAGRGLAGPLPQARRLEKAADDLRKALELAALPEKVAFIQKQLSTVLALWAASLDAERTSSGTATARDLARSERVLRLLEEALELDPGNELARGYLDYYDR